MSKIVTAVNSMISNADKISDVTRLEVGGNLEYVFKYNNKYVWGISKHGEILFLYLYPKTKEITEINANIIWSSFEFISYNTEELKTREALESFAELYLIVKEKLHNVDGVLDDIIGDLE